MPFGDVRITKVTVNSRAVYRAVKQPGGTGGGGWFRDFLIEDIQATAIKASPVNNPLNARHRGGRVGTYKRSWKKRRPASAAWITAGQVSNTARHAGVVEFGRSASSKPQRFSWTRWRGRIRWAGSVPWAAMPFTGARPGNYVLTKAVRAAWARRYGHIVRARYAGPYRRLPGFNR